MPCIASSIGPRYGHASRKARDSVSDGIANAFVVGDRRRLAQHRNPCRLALACGDAIEHAGQAALERSTHFVAGASGISAYKEGDGRGAERLAAGVRLQRISVMDSPTMTIHADPERVGLQRSHRP